MIGICGYEHVAISCVFREIILFVKQLFILGLFKEVRRLRVSGRDDIVCLRDN